MSRAHLPTETVPATAPGTSRPIPARAAVLAAAVALLFAPPALGQAPDGEAPAGRPGALGVGASHRLTVFGSELDPWLETSFHLTHRSGARSYIARLNHARRFGVDGLQLEADAYPKLGDGRYAYLNVGYSGARIFPEWRAGGELYQNLPASMEASLGFRHLRFTSSKVTLLTGSVGLYRGDFWYSLRPFLHAGERSGSLTFLARRYGEGPDDYWGFYLGAGSGVGEVVVAEDLDRLSSFKAGLEGRVPVRSRWLVRWSAGAEWEELTRDRTRSRLSLGLGIERGF